MNEEIKEDEFFENNVLEIQEQSAGAIVENSGETTDVNPDELAFESYKRKSVSEMRPVIDGETADYLSLMGVSVSKEDLEAGSPVVGDLIARNPKNHKDMWLVSKAYAEDNLEILEETDAREKTLGMLPKL